MSRWEFARNLWVGLFIGAVLTVALLYALGVR